MSILTKAVDFSLSVWDEELPKEVIESSKRALIDFMAVTLSGSEEPVSRRIQKYGYSQSAKSESKVFGTDLVLSRNYAALANSVAAHAQDFDDVSLTLLGHPTITVAPAVLAISEGNHASGMDILKSYAIGVEVMNKIASLMMPMVSSNGWHTTSVFGPFGAATSSALLNRLDQRSFVAALGIAASKASGVRSNFGTMTKPYHAGMATFNGVTATTLASLGITASKNAIEAEDGFAATFSGGNIHSLSPRFGSPWDIVTPGLVFKKYPCCSGTHPAIDCILKILQDSPFKHAEVETIYVGVSLLGPRELVCHNPSTPTEARFSMQFALAAAIVYGRVSLIEFTEESITDPRIKKLMSKVKMTVDPELEKLGFIGTAPVKLQIRLKDGRVIEGRSNLAKGSPENPLTDSELSLKFMECATRVFEKERCERILDSLFSLEEIEDVRDFFDLL